MAMAYEWQVLSVRRENARRTRARAAAAGAGDSAGVGRAMAGDGRTRRWRGRVAATIWEEKRSEGGGRAKDE